VATDDLIHVAILSASPIRYGAKRTLSVELENQKRAWLTEWELFDFDGYAPNEVTDDVRERAECELRRKAAKYDVSRKPKDDLSSAVSLATLSDVEVWMLLKKDPVVTERSKALEELVGRRSPDIGGFIQEELSRNDLQATWRNTLLFAAEHADFVEPARSRMRENLRRFVGAINQELHPRSRLAQEAAIRRYISLLDDKRDLNLLRSFLGTGYPIAVRRIVLIGVKIAFASEPPSSVLQEALLPLRRDLMALSRFFLSVDVLEQSEEDFGLGLDALEAILRLGEPNALQLVRLATDVPRRWIRRQLSDSCRQTLASWSRLSDPPCPQCCEWMERVLEQLSANS
jgi:hypothetical protein